MREKQKAFSLIQYILNRFPSIPSSQLRHLLFLSLRSTDPLLLFRKKQDSKRQPPNMEKQDIIRQGKSSHVEGGQGSPIGGKECQDEAKESETHSLLMLVPWKHQL